MGTFFFCDGGASVKCLFLFLTRSRCRLGRGGGVARLGARRGVARLDAQLARAHGAHPRVESQDTRLSHAQSEPSASLPRDVPLFPISLQRGAPSFPIVCAEEASETHTDWGREALFNLSRRVETGLEHARAAAAQGSVARTPQIASPARVLVNSSKGREDIHSDDESALFRRGRALVRDAP